MTARPPIDLAQSGIEPAAGIDVGVEALARSRRNAMRRLVRCLFAEGILDVARLVFSPDGARLPLVEPGAHLAFERLVVAPAATVLVHGSILWVREGGRPALVDHPDDLIDLLQPLFDFETGAESVAALKVEH